MMVSLKDMFNKRGSTMSLPLLFYISGTIAFSSCNTDKSTTNYVLPLTDSLDTYQETIYSKPFHYIEDSLVLFDFINPTYLGNEKRNYYGNKAPSSLKVLWKTQLGEGSTMIGDSIKKWKGAGWTGQPLLVSENGKEYIIQGAYDHHLRKIDFQTGKEIWRYKYDDVIKGTGSLYYNKEAKSLEDKILILQGSRKGLLSRLYDKNIYSYRAVSYFSGKEKWRLNSPLTRSYSRDVDGSALIIGDTAYLGFENGIFQKFSPKPSRETPPAPFNQPEIYAKHTTYTKKDIATHRGNLVSESSPSKLGDTIYFSSGAGHIWGYNIQKDTLDWEYFTGSDMDGSIYITNKNTLVATVEKQYIQGRGGIIHIDPRADSVLWYFPTKNEEFIGWEGGIIGSASTNELTKTDSTPHFTATNSIDGNLYVVYTHTVDSCTVVKGFDNKTEFPTPRVAFTYKIGPSISTPIFVGDKLIAAGYKGLYLFQYKNDTFELIDKYPGVFESTPLVHDNSILIASKGDGYLYKFGSNETILQHKRSR